MKTTPAHCYFCQQPIGLLDVHYPVRRASKPPRRPHRYVRIGTACETCGDAHDTTIDAWTAKRT